MGAQVVVHGGHVGTQESAGPLRLGADAHAALRPAAARLSGGFWQERRQRNAEVSIPAGAEQLERAGNLHNLRLAAGTATGAYRGTLPFLDSDVHKWLEAASWRLAEADDPGLADRAEEIIELLAAAQQDDGYLQSYFQVTRPGERFVDLQWGHELYCAGHLIQAAVARARATGRDDLLAIARRVADHIDATFGEDRLDGVCGHPEIETALVELYRQTGERKYLDRAGYFIDRRGYGLLGDDRFGRAYWQDHTPLRDAETAVGHAVRQLYLLAGAADVYAETGERALLDAVVRLWDDAVSAKTYLTGGMGSHHTDEAFGDPYELPSDRAYCETCAAIASIMLSWRLLLITGEARYADLMERTLYNGFLSGISLDGERYLYVNPLQVRDGHGARHNAHGSARKLAPHGDHDVVRMPWFRCACCPPNVMRLLASLPHYFAATDRSGLTIHQYGNGEFGGAEFAVRVDTDYPTSGRIEATVTATRETPWTLTLRVPQWCPRPRLRVNGAEVAAEVTDGWLQISRPWQIGDTTVLELDMAPRLVTPDRRIDAVRGCVAIERGPLVYCLERTDQPDDIGLDDIAIDTAAELAETQRPDLLGGVTVITAAGNTTEKPRTGWPYGTADPPPTRPITLTAVPYYAWANREVGSMRVWIPAAERR